MSRKVINISKYKELIKQQSPLKNIEDIKYEFCVTSKFDGIRSLLYIDEKTKVFIITNNSEDIIETNIITNVSNTLIDGEMVDNKIFYASDLIFYENNMLEDKIFIERLNILDHDISIMVNEKSIIYKIKKYYFDKIYENSKKILIKKYSYVYGDKKYVVLTKGLIFIKIKSNYLNTTIFKWQLKKNNKRYDPPPYF